MEKRVWVRNGSHHLAMTSGSPYRPWVGRCCRNAQISNIFG
jgi:hypothetical protein